MQAEAKATMELVREKTGLAYSLDLFAMKWIFLENMITRWSVASDCWSRSYRDHQRSNLKFCNKQGD
jgi:hypothetical protein